MRALLKKKFGYFDLMGIYITMSLFRAGAWPLALAVLVVGSFLSAQLDIKYGIERGD